MNHFYLTLPSNSSMGVYPNNTTAQFTTKLPNVVELDGNWEVALSEIIYPHTWDRVGKDDGLFEIMRHGGLHSEYALSEGYYSNVKEVVDEMRAVLISGSESSNVAVNYDERANRVEIYIAPGRDVVLHSKLVEMLGFESGNLMSGREYRSITTPKAGADLWSMFVYCDIIEHGIVGDCRAPLLRIVRARGKRGKVVHSTYTNPIYVPLQKHHFDSVEINIMTDTGKPVSFASGKSAVILHFRRARYPSI